MAKTNPLEEVRRRKSFYMRLTPFYGHQYAADHGFPYSDNDAAAKEVEDAAGLWMKLSHDHAGTIISDASWWMLPLLDPTSKLSSSEGVAIYNKLNAFVTTTIGMLADAGSITINIDDVDMPRFASADTDLTDEQSQEFKDMVSLFDSYPTFERDTLVETTDDTEDGGIEGVTDDE